MILADKITEERKRLGLSQEELAEKLSVSRQAVSKWESAQSVPELQKIVMLSELFSVSTDYLLKEEAETERSPKEDRGSDEPLRRVSLEEANAFFSATQEESRGVSLGVLLCIVSPVLLVVLSGLSDTKLGLVSETAAAAVGLLALFLLIAAAVFLFIRSGVSMEKYEYLHKESFETAYGVTGLAKERKEAFEPTYIRSLSLGIVLFVLSPLPVALAALMGEDNALVVFMAAVLLCIVGFGVYRIVRVAIVKSGYQIILQEGEYNKTEKKRGEIASVVNAAYWCIATAVYLLWSFTSGKWESTWIVWVVAGVLSAPVMLLAKQLGNREEQKNP